MISEFGCNRDSIQKRTVQILQEWKNERMVVLFFFSLNSCIAHVPWHHVSCELHARGRLTTQRTGHTPETYWPNGRSGVLSLNDEKKHNRLWFERSTCFNSVMWLLLMLIYSCCCFYLLVLLLLLLIFFYYRCHFVSVDWMAIWWQAKRQHWPFCHLFSLNSHSEEAFLLLFFLILFIFSF